MRALPVSSSSTMGLPGEEMGLVLGRSRKLSVSFAEIPTLLAIFDKEIFVVNMLRAVLSKPEDASSEGVETCFSVEEARIGRVKPEQERE